MVQNLKLQILHTHTVHGVILQTTLELSSMYLIVTMQNFKGYVMYVVWQQEHLTRLYLNHAKFQILVMNIVRLQTLQYCTPPCKISNFY